MTISSTVRPWALPKGGVEFTDRRQTGKSVQTDSQAPKITTKNLAKDPKAYPIGKLLFWDKNEDGRFRWTSGDYVTTASGEKLSCLSRQIRNTLRSRGIRHAWRLNPIEEWTNSLLPKKTNSREPQSNSENVLSLEKQIKDQKHEVGLYMNSGNYGLFQEALEKYERLLRTANDPLPPETAEALKNEARMNSYLFEAADSLRENREDLALSALRRAREYAIKAGVPWEREMVLESLELFGSDKLPQDKVDQVLDRVDWQDPAAL